jgi:hypothetical protein
MNKTLAIIAVTNSAKKNELGKALCFLRQTQAPTKAAVADAKTASETSLEPAAKCKAQAAAAEVTIGAPPIKAAPKVKSQIFCERVIID